MSMTVNFENFFKVLDHSPVGMFILQNDYTVVFWNRCLEYWSGIIREDILGTNIGDRYPHLKQDQYRLRIDPIFSGGPPAIFSSQLHKNIIPIMLRNNTYQIQHTKVAATPDVDGQGYLALFSIEDVTELTNRINGYRAMREQALEEIEQRKTVEKALSDSEKKYRLLAENTEDVIWTIDKEGRLTYISPSISKWHGVSPEEAMGEGSKKTMSPESYRRLRTLLKDRKGEYTHGENVVDRIELEHYHSDGSAFWMESIIRNLYDDAGDLIGMIGMTRDIHEARQLRKQRESLIDELQQALAEVKILQGFLPICSHCKKIRDDAGYWQKIEKYIQDRSAAVFSHGVCPDCKRIFYSDFI